MRIFRHFSLLITLAFSAHLHAAEALVNTHWLSAHLKDKNITLVDMSGEYTQYQRFHIPGAIYLPYEMIVQQRRDGVSFAVEPQQLSELLGLLGIEANIHIIIYDDIGGLNASRFYWQLEQVGHRDVSILDGGLVKWIREGRPVTGTPTETSKTRYLGRSVDRGNLASLADVRKASRDKQTVLLDARSEEEYIGNPRYKRSGHIPGALHVPWDQDVDFEAGFTMKEGRKLMPQLQQAGLPKNRDTLIITYCQSGHRAAHLYFSLKRLGYRNVRLYDGSMAEYIKVIDAPLKLGNSP